VICSSFSLLYRIFLAFCPVILLNGKIFLAKNLILTFCLEIVLFYFFNIFGQSSNKMGFELKAFDQSRRSPSLMLINEGVWWHVWSFISEKTSWSTFIFIINYFSKEVWNWPEISFRENSIKNFSPSQIKSRLSLLCLEHFSGKLKRQNLACFRYLKCGWLAFVERSHPKALEGFSAVVHCWILLLSSWVIASRPTNRDIEYDWEFARPS